MSRAPSPQGGGLPNLKQTFSHHDHEVKITLLAAPCNLGGTAPEPLRPETSGAGLEGHGASPQTPLPFGIAQKEAKRLVFFIGRAAWRAGKGWKLEGLRPIFPEAMKAP